MRFTAIERITADVREADSVVLTNDRLQRAENDYAATQRTVRPAMAHALFEPSRPAEHAAALAAYAVWLADLMGWDDNG